MSDLYTDAEIELLLKVDQALKDGKGWEDIAEMLGMSTSNAFTKVRELGYQTGKHLVPRRNAPSIDALRAKKAAA